MQDEEKRVEMKKKGLTNNWKIPYKSQLAGKHIHLYCKQYVVLNLLSKGKLGEFSLTNFYKLPSQNMEV